MPTSGLRSSAILFDETLVLSGDGDDHNPALISELLRACLKIDDVFASFKRLAIRTYEACQVKHLSIATDLKVIECSNLGVASLLNPVLTTITQPSCETGREAAAILLRAIEKKRLPLPTQSVVQC